MEGFAIPSARPEWIRTFVDQRDALHSTAECYCLPKNNNENWNKNDDQLRPVDNPKATQKNTDKFMAHLWRHEPMVLRALKLEARVIYF